MRACDPVILDQLILQIEAWRERHSHRSASCVTLTRDGAAKRRRSGDNRQHSGYGPLSQPLVQSHSSVFPRAEALCICFDAFSIYGHGNRVPTLLENAIAQRSGIRSFHIPSIRASLERLRAILRQKRNGTLALGRRPAGLELSKVRRPLKVKEEWSTRINPLPALR